MIIITVLLLFTAYQFGYRNGVYTDGVLLIKRKHMLTVLDLVSRYAVQ